MVYRMIIEKFVNVLCGYVCSIFFSGEFFFVCDLMVLNVGVLLIWL